MNSQRIAIIKLFTALHAEEPKTALSLSDYTGFTKRIVLEWIKLLRSLKMEGCTYSIVRISAYYRNPQGSHAPMYQWNFDDLPDMNKLEILTSAERSARSKKKKRIINEFDRIMKEQIRIATASQVQPKTKWKPKKRQPKPSAAEGDKE